MIFWQCPAQVFPLIKIPITQKRFLKGDADLSSMDGGDRPFKLSTADHLIPVGFNKNNLSMGMQIIGRKKEDLGDILCKKI